MKNKGSFDLLEDLLHKEQEIKGFKVYNEG